MAGFGTILEKPIHDAFPDRIVNTHPALLPAFKGWHAVDDALAAGVKVTGCTVHLARARGRRRPDPRPGGGAGARRRHRRDAARAHQGGRAPALPRGARGSWSQTTERMIARALLSVYDKTGLVDFARGAPRPRRASWCRRAAPPRRSPRPASRSPTSPTSPGSRRCSTTGWSRCTRRSTAASSPTGARTSHRRRPGEYGIEPFDLVVSNLYPFRERPDIETIDIGGPAMMRAAAKNHAWVGDRHRARRSTTRVLDELRDRRRARATRPGARSRSRRSRTPPRTTPRSCAWLAGATSRCPQHLVLALERTDEALRYGENPHQHGGALPHRGHRRAGGTASQQHGGLALCVPQPLRHRRRVAARARPRRPARRARSSSTPTRAASRSPTTSPPRTSARSSATSARRSAASSR